MSSPLLIDPSLLEGLTDEQRKEALEAAASARRAEERAEQRALERAVEERRQQRLRQQQREEEEAHSRRSLSGKGAGGSGGVGGGPPPMMTPAQAMRLGTGKASGVDPGIRFVSKGKRKAQEAEGKEEENDGNVNGAAAIGDVRVPKPPGVVSSSVATVPAAASGSRSSNSNGSRNSNNGPRNNTTNAIAPPSSGPPNSSSWTEQERQAVRRTYLGTSAAVLSDAEYLVQQQAEQQRKKKKTKLGKKAMFRFEWDDTDDTLQADDPLYSGTAAVGGRRPGQAAAAGGGRRGEDGGGSQHHSARRTSSSSRQHPAAYVSISTKPLDQMTARDWRILRENYEIVVRGGRAPPPLRSFTDGNLLHPDLLNALTKVMKYREPSPIQRQAIPIGLQRRDMIGIGAFPFRFRFVSFVACRGVASRCHHEARIGVPMAKLTLWLSPLRHNTGRSNDVLTLFWGAAETGSGKTAAFGIPLLQYIIQLPKDIQQRVAEHGPLAMVVAPTRELALQIHGEMEKMLHYRPDLTCCAIVGGQSLQQQAQHLRKGVHVIVGTPGRINECIDMAYMVLNQCLYIVFDEGDRMIDSTYQMPVQSVSGCFCVVPRLRRRLTHWVPCWPCCCLFPSPCYSLVSLTAVSRDTHSGECILKNQNMPGLFL